MIQLNCGFMTVILVSVHGEELNSDEELRPQEWRVDSGFRRKWGSGVCRRGWERGGRRWHWTVWNTLLPPSLLLRTQLLLRKNKQIPLPLSSPSYCFLILLWNWNSATSSSTFLFCNPLFVCSSQQQPPLKTIEKLNKRLILSSSRIYRRWQWNFCLALIHCFRLSIYLRFQ